MWDSSPPLPSSSRRWCGRMKPAGFGWSEPPSHVGAHGEYCGQPCTTHTKDALEGRELPIKFDQLGGPWFQTDMKPCCQQLCGAWKHGWAMGDADNAAVVHQNAAITACAAQPDDAFDDEIRTYHGDFCPCKELLDGLLPIILLLSV